MLTGRHPFMEEDESGSTPSVLTRQISSPLYLPRTEGMTASTRLTLQRCLEKDPRLRPRDATCLRRQLGSEGRLTWLFHHLRLRRPLRFTLLGTAALTLTILGFLWFTLPASRIVQEDQSLIAQNPLGRAMWSREPAQGERLAGWTANRDDQDKLKLKVVYAPASNPYSYTLDTINPQDFPIRLAFFDHQGKPNDDLNLLYTYLTGTGRHVDYFDFYPFSRVAHLMKKDLDDDGQAELLLITHQASGMFPSQLTLAGRDRLSLHTIFSPGFFDPQSITPSGQTAPEAPLALALLSQSNPFCHYMVWSWNIKDAKTLIPPCYDAVGMSYMKTQDLVILPQRSRLVRNDWRAEKRATFFSPDSEINLEVSADGRMTISGFEDSGFTENFQANSTALSILNRVFFHLSRQQSALAAQAMDKLDSSTINNPWLLSLIRYFQAETAIQNDDFISAEALLRRALIFDPDNGDARNRLAELAVLRQGPKAGLIFLEENSQYSGHFWGLGQGQALFRSCCLLMAGNPEEAAQSLASLTNNREDSDIRREESLQALASLYQSNRSSLSRALSRLPDTQTILSPLFDVTEQQLMLARLRMVGGEWQKAEPFLRLFTTQTVLHKFYAEVSLAWCEAESGQTKRAVERADLAFAQIRRMARGQFWARYWLFYDAYAYGRTMEKAGQPQKAREGYRLCADLAPQSFLGQEAKARADRLP
jgi:tetratricopeptide (TPR) repeat protein